MGCAALRAWPRHPRARLDVLRGHARIVKYPVASPVPCIVTPAPDQNARTIDIARAGYRAAPGDDDVVALLEEVPAGVRGGRRGGERCAGSQNHHPQRDGQRRAKPAYAPRAAPRRSQVRRTHHAGVRRPRRNREQIAQLLVRETALRPPRAEHPPRRTTATLRSRAGRVKQRGRTAPAGRPHSAAAACEDLCDCAGAGATRGSAWLLPDRP